MLNLALHSAGFIAVLLLHPACAQLAGASPPPLPLFGRDLHRRNSENVVLADCRDTNAVVSSQIAYFKGAPGKAPEDVAVVHTNPGEAALWINTNTSALFTDTGVTFTATIGPKVADGSFAGTGNNGYGSFVCYQKYLNNLYEYGGTACSQVYYCNHDPLPSDAATILNPNPTSSSTPGTTTGASSGATPSAGANSGGGLSQGALIGILVGIIGTLVVAASFAFFFWTWRRYQSQKPGAGSGRSSGCCGLFVRGEAQQQQQPPSHAAHARGMPLPNHDVKRGPGMYEMDGAWRRAEMGDTHEKYELDAVGGLGSTFNNDNKDTKLVVPEGLGGLRPDTPQKKGYPEIYALAPGTPETAVSEQKVRVQDILK